MKLNPYCIIAIFAGWYIGNAFAELENKREKAKVICRIEERDAKNIRNFVNNESLKEISDIILEHIKTGSEKGGEVNFHNRLIFYQNPNIGDTQINKIDAWIECIKKHGKQEFNCKGYNLDKIIDEMKSTMQYNFEESECSISVSDIGWKEHINKINNLLNKTETTKDYNYLVEALKQYKTLFSSTYFQDNSSKNTIGYNIGGMHTHSNDTNFSNTDKCLSKKNPSIFYFLASFKDENEFNLIAMCNGESKLIGKYNIIR
ncbi:hypothetical protein J4440_03070 [Candidatus Woesearchaeota archaeon]|nr:hypothetical protein [Candidatus Woesearchaeota archaeon]